MGHTEQAEFTVLCLLKDGDRILLQNRVKTDWQGYTLPGGHVEPEESFVEAVIREMQEETGLTVYQPRLRGIKQFPIKGGRYIVALFQSEQFSGTLRSSAEGEMHWVSRADLPKLPVVEHFAELLQVVEDDAFSELQYIENADGSWQPRLL